MIHWFIRPSERRVGAFLALCTLFSAGAVAQTRPDAGTILDTVREPTAPIPTRPGVQLAPEPPRPARQDDSLKMTVKAFRVSGNTLLTDAEIQGVLAQYVSTEQNFAGLESVAEEVQKLYRGKGFIVARAYLPRQDWKSGVVEIHVLEGRIGKVDVRRRDGARLNDSIAKGYMRRVDEGEVVRFGEIERQLRLLGDLPGTTVFSTLGPRLGPDGKPIGKPGEVDLNVEYGDDGQPVTGSLEVENFGNKFAGAIRFGGQAVINNPTGFGDKLTLRGLVSQDALTEVVGISYAVPVGYWGTRISASVSQMRYKLGGSLAASRASGEGDLASLLVVHPFVRSGGFNLFGQFSADIKELEDRVDSVAGLEQRRIKLWKIGVFGDTRDGLLGGGLNTFGATASIGDLRMLNPILATNDSISFNTAGSFSKINLEFQRVQHITNDIYGILRTSYQAASKNLASAEKVSVGGPFGVRAYPIGEGLADEALQLSLEARYTLRGFKLLDDLKFLKDSEVTLSGFLDGASVRRYRNQNQVFDLDPVTFAPLPNQRTFWGAGFGVRVGQERNYSVVAELAWRLGDEQPTSDVPRHPTLWVRGVKWF